jgi:hypothetical protein
MVLLKVSKIMIKQLQSFNALYHNVLASGPAFIITTEGNPQEAPNM